MGTTHQKYYTKFIGHDAHKYNTKKRNCYNTPHKIKYLNSHLRMSGEKIVVYFNFITVVPSYI